MKATTGIKNLKYQSSTKCNFFSLHSICFRTLHTTVTADYETSNRKDCALTLKYDFPADIYVDKYELATIALNRKVSTYYKHYYFFETVHKYFVSLGGILS